MTAVDDLILVICLAIGIAAAPALLCPLRHLYEAYQTWRFNRRWVRRQRRLWSWR